MPIANNDPSATDSGTPLRPCPLCQGKALGEEHAPHKHVFATFMPDHPGSYTIECPRCNLGLIADTEADAKAAWNSRVGDAALSDALAKLALAAEYEAGTEELIREMKGSTPIQFCPSCDAEWIPAPPATTK